MEDRMTVDTPTLFTAVIQEHLDLKRRNAELEKSMPLGHYQTEDPFENHPLFKTEEQALIEDTMDGVPAPAEADPYTRLEESSEDLALHGLWSRPRDFDWGD
jgi:hypothetical protein